MTYVHASDPYLSFFEHSFDGAVVVDDSENCIMANASACEMLGIRKEELEGTKITQLYEFAQNTSGQKINNKIVKNIRQGQHLWILRSDNTGRATTGPGFHSALMQAPFPIAILTGPDFKYILANPHYERIVGRKVLHLSLQEAYDPEEIKGYLPTFEKVLKTGETVSVKEAFYQLPDRSSKMTPRYLNIDYHPYQDLHHKTIGVMVIIHDVTKLVLAREKIQESEARYKTLSECLPQLIWSCDHVGNPTFANNRFLQYTGASSQAEFFEKWKTFIHSDDLETVREVWKTSLTSGVTFTKEFRIRDDKGEYRWFLGKAIPLRQENDQVIQWIGTATDIDDQKKFIKNLEEERSSREQFVSMLSHDLRNPLAAAKFSAQLILRYGNDHDKLPILANKIIEGVSRADKMILNLLDANRITAGENLSLNLEECHLNSLLSETIEELSGVHGNRFILDCDPMIYGVWSTDSLRRIIENLCTNAIKYGDKERPVRIKAHQLDDLVTISVNNKGAPIGEEELAKLFDPFHRAKTVEESGSSGWGLGLTLVRGLTQAHSGEVFVESSIDEGTTFTVKLPRLVRAMA